MTDKQKQRRLDNEKLLTDNFKIVKAGFSQEDQAFISSRQYAKMNDYPKNVRTDLSYCIAHVLINYPKTKKIFLTGSYANGLYIHTSDNKEDIKRLKRLKEKKGKKISDFDLYIEPSVKEQTQIKTDFGIIDIIPFLGRRNVAIFEKGEKVTVTKKSGWKFDGLNDNQKKLLRAAGSEEKWTACLELCTRFGVVNACSTCGMLQTTKKWITWAMAMGKI